ncbi:MAG: mannose-1-phosphate guanyltransferase [Endomicrobiales bacterium]|nr:mannose-1-phosphate guanyltransferase [Endomicrobiales bacterium]
MQTVIMAGGFGTRLRPLTVNTPKPMAPIGNRPMLAHIVELLKSHDLCDLTMMLYYQPEVITSYFGDGSKMGVKIRYLKPESDLGTAGSVRFAEKQLKDTFLVISGDVLTDFNLKEAIKFHNSKKAVATMVLARVTNPLQYGVVITSGDGKIERFLEKPSWGEVFSDTINTGIYILEPSVLEHVPHDKSFDFSKDLFPQLLKDKKPLYGYVAQGYWKDIGNHDEYRMAHYDILDGITKIAVDGKKTKVGDKDIIAGEGTKIDPSVQVDGQVIIGKNCVVEKGVKISRSVIGSNVKIGPRCEIIGSILWDDVALGSEVRLKEDVICRKTRIGDKAVVQVGTIISDECDIGAGAIIRTNLRIWPHKTVEEGAVLSTSLVWGEKWNRALFGAYAITGLGNIEITPEFAAKIGSAYGAHIGKGAYVITSRDAHKASRMVKRTMISGLLSAGVRVGDLRTAPIPVVRYELGKEGEAGGIHVRQSPFDARLIDIKFFDKDGSDISIQQEKAIEQLFHREDFKRAGLDEVGELTVPPRAQEYYKGGYLKAIDRKSIGSANFKVVLDYAFSSASMVFPAILGELGLEVVTLNAFINPNKITKTESEFKHSLNQLSDIVTTLRGDVGFLIDTGAEKVFLVDERGRIVPDELAMIIIADLVMRTFKGGTVAVPVHISSVIDKLAERYDVKVKRTAASARQLTATAREKGVVFLSDCQGGYIFPEFQPAFDAMYAIGKILEMMAKLGVHLNKISREIPPFEVLHKKLPCPWDKKGQIMRNAIGEAKNKKVELIDGVKIFFGDSWVLLLPDPDEAYFHVWAEAEDGKTARDLIREYTEKVRKWQE